MPFPLSPSGSFNNTTTASSSNDRDRALMPPPPLPKSAISNPCLQLMKDVASLQLGEITDSSQIENVQGRLVAHRYLSMNDGHSCDQQAYLDPLAKEAAKSIIRNNPTILADIVTK